MCGIQNELKGNEAGCGLDLAGEGGVGENVCLWNVLNRAKEKRNHRRPVSHELGLLGG